MRPLAIPISASKAARPLPSTIRPPTMAISNIDHLLRLFTRGACLSPLGEEECVPGIPGEQVLSARCEVPRGECRAVLLHTERRAVEQLKEQRDQRPVKLHSRI